MHLYIDRIAQWLANMPTLSLHDSQKNLVGVESANTSVERKQSRKIKRESIRPMMRLSLAVVGALS